MVEEKLDFEWVVSLVSMEMVSTSVLLRVVTQSLSHMM